MRRHSTAARPLALALAALLAACAGGDAPSEPTSARPPVAPSPEPPAAPTPTTASLVLQLADVPTGGAPTVTLRNGATVRTLSGAGRVDGLAPGTWEVRAAPLVVGGVTWRPEPETQDVTLTAGQPAPTVSVRFRAVGATVVLRATGLPSYARATIRLQAVPAAGAPRVALSGDTVRGLDAGAYLLTTDALETTDGRFVPLADRLELTLATDQQAGAEFAFVRASATLRVQIDGLPGGAPAAVQVTGPNGFERRVDTTSTFAELAPGLYAARAARVRHAGFSWDPDATYRDAALSGIQQRTVAIGYAIATGAIAVSVTGLPSGTTGAVTITGPGGFSRTLTATETITDLAPGSYVVTATDRTAAGVTFEPSPRTRTVTVTPSLVAHPAPVVYEGAYGRLRLTVRDLPAGLEAPVTITGPGGFRVVATGDTLLGGLTPGSYLVTAGTVLAGTREYAPVTSPVTVAVAPRAEATATVTYRETTASSLGLVITGLPAGVTANVRVTGPGGFDESVPASAVLFNLTPGAYTLTAQPVAHGGFTYAASPATRTLTVAPGEASEASVDYAPVTGRLTVSVSGLPTGVAAAVTVTGPNGYARTVTGTTTLEDLAAGPYAVGAVVVNAGGSLWVPSPAQQAVTVTAGSTSLRSVAYSQASTSLTVTIGGLPAGVNAAVTVTGPGSFTRVLTATQLLTDLAGGTYQLAASTVTSAGVSYTPAPVTQSVTVVAGQVNSASVNYTASLGALALTVAGLPAGVNGAITVTGPNGFSQAVTATATLPALPTGSYTIAAAGVTAGGTTYTASPASQAATVTAGATVSRTVTYTASAAGPNLVLEGAYITQAIQRLAGDVPLVAGREALLRVFVTASQANTFAPSVRVRLYEGPTLFRTLTIAAPGTSVPQTVTEGTLGSSWNASLSASDLRPNLRLLVDVDPGNTIVETEEADNAWPRSGTQALDVRPVAPFSVVFVPVHQSANGLTGNVTAGNVEGTFLSMTRSIFPLAAVNASVRATFTTSAPELQSSDGNGAWLTVLNEIRALQIAEGGTAHYYGVVNTTYASGIAGFAYVPGRAGVGWDKPGSANRVTAHELGHNFGRLHVAACGSGNVDAGYPHAGGTIGHTGWNPGTGTLVASSVTDIMGYCNTQWISDYTWSGVMAHRGTGAFAAGFAAGMGATEQPALLVWGRVHRGQVVLEPAVRLVTRPAVAPRPGRYRLELRDSTGRALTGFTFDPEAVDHDAEAQAFAFAVPLDAFIEGRLASVAVVDDRRRETVRTTSTGMTARLATRRAEAALGAASARQAIVRSDDGRHDVVEPGARVVRAGRLARLSWDAAAWPLALVRDAATGQVVAMLRRADAGFVPPAGGAVRVTWSDGVRSLTRDLPAR